MTVWDADNLNAPHTLRELAQDGEPATGSTTEPGNATCPSEGGFGGRPEHRLIAAAREALEIVKAGNLRKMTLDEAWAQRLSNLKPMATDEAIAHALRNDAGWMAWQEVQRLRAENARLRAAIEYIAKQKRTDELETEYDVDAADFEGGWDALINVARAARAPDTRKEVMPDAAPISRGFSTPATSPGVTAGAVLTAIAAEKAEWPHAGSMHDGARMACDAIAERVKKLMGVA